MYMYKVYGSSCFMYYLLQMVCLISFLVILLFIEMDQDSLHYKLVCRMSIIFYATVI